jgi:hypothetical protein
MKKKYLKSIAIVLIVAFSLASYIYLNYSISDQVITDQAIEVLNNESSEASMFADLGILKGIISKVVELVTFTS